MKILLMGHGGFLAHTTRLELIGKELRRRGHDVAVAGDGWYQPRLANIADRSYYAYTEPKERVLTRMRGQTEMQRNMTYDSYLNDINQMAIADMQVLKKEDPDVVVGDFRFSLSVSTWDTATPYVSITNSHWLPEWHADTLDNAAQRAINTADEYWGEAYGAVGINTCGCSERNRESLSSFFNALRGDETIIADDPLFSWAGRDEQYHYVGPLVDLTPGDAGFVRRNDRPHIYISMGSSGDDAVLGTIITALAEEPVEMMLTLPEGSTVDELGGLIKQLPNVQVAPFVNGFAAMQLADMVICHAGSGTIYQAIAANRPIVAVPTHNEQMLLGNQVEAKDIGICVRNIHHKNIRDAADYVSRHDFANLYELHKNAKTWNAPMLVADKLEELYGDS